MKNILLLCILIMAHASFAQDSIKAPKKEHADLSKSFLLELNLIDLVNDKISINGEIYPTKNRKFSVQISTRFSWNQYGDDRLWHSGSKYEFGLGSNYYYLRSHLCNLHIGIESNYSYAGVNVPKTSYDGFSNPSYYVVSELRHYFGFYLNNGFKFNFHPRIGASFGVGVGWKFASEYSRNVSQLKADAGLFFRF